MINPQESIVTEEYLKKTQCINFEKKRIKNEISTLTSFRFIIAFVVFLFHCKQNLGFNFGIKVIDRFINNGAVFMTGFFVLSGYIMSYVYINNDFRKKGVVFNFYLKRFLRIYPVYIIATIIYFIFIPSTYAIGDWIRIIINDIFAVQALFPNMFKLGPNGGTWSISVEFFFYFLFPALVILFAKKPKALLLTGLTMSLIITINIHGLSHSNQHNIASFFVCYFNPIMRVDEFMVGIAFYLLNKKGSLEKLPRILKSSWFISLLIFTLTQSHNNTYMGLNLLIIPLFGLLIFNLHNLKYGPMKNSRILNYLGKVSYSFYMWQFICLKFGIFLSNHYGFNAWNIMLMALAINIVISAISYHLIEEKIRFFLMGKIKNKSNKKT